MTGSPTFNYMMLALLATLLTVALIVIVDHPRGRRLFRDPSSAASILCRTDIPAS